MHAKKTMHEPLKEAPCCEWVGAESV